MHHAMDVRGNLSFPLLDQVMKVWTRASTLDQKPLAQPRAFHVLEETPWLTPVAISQR